MAKKPTTEETAAANVPATTSEKATAALIGGKPFALKRMVTLPLLKQKDNEDIAITILTPMKVSAYWVKEHPGYVPGEPFKGEGGKTIAPSYTVEVTELNSGAHMLYLVPAVMQSTLEQEYANDSYVGKSFMIRKLPAAAGKRFKDMQIAEIELG